MPEQGPVQDPEALLATTARLFAADGDSVAVEVLSEAVPEFEWVSHDNWDGGFDIWRLNLEVPMRLFLKLGSRKAALEGEVLKKLQAVVDGHTGDHIEAVLIRSELKAGDWRAKAREWIGATMPRTEGSDVLAPVGAVVRPRVFSLPKVKPDPELVAVMMPFAAEFDSTLEAIREASSALSLNCKRADDVWQHSTIIQDIVDLIYQARVLVVDFTGRNANVMYETGIAHTLGREVIPITQNIQDVPFDLRHHRALTYFPNAEGLKQLTSALRLRLSSLTGRTIG